MASSPIPHFSVRYFLSVVLLSSLWPHGAKLFYHLALYRPKSPYDIHRAPAHFRKDSPYDRLSTDIAVRRELVCFPRFRQRSLASVPWPAINWRRRRPATPRQVERDRECSVEDRDSRIGLVFAHCLGRQNFRHLGHQLRRDRTAEEGALFRRRTRRPTGRTPLDGVLRRLEVGED